MLTDFYESFIKNACKSTPERVNINVAIGGEAAESTEATHNKKETVTLLDTVRFFFLNLPVRLEPLSSTLLQKCGGLRFEKLGRKKVPLKPNMSQITPSNSIITHDKMILCKKSD